MNFSAYQATTLVNTYAWAAGTSMAVAKVSAVAALIIDQAKTRGERLTPAQVITRLERTALGVGKPGCDQAYGYGLVDAYSALGGQ
jgi:subtilisin family serine protease